MKAFFILLFRFTLTLTIAAAALAAGAGLWDYYMNAPWTRDGRVRADVVEVTPDVSGLVSSVMVQDNQAVKRGDLLFRIDPERFRLALEQAEAVVAGKKAMADQTGADYDRYSKLSDAAVSQQKLELARASALQATAAFDQAKADRDVAKLNLVRSDVRASVNGRIANMDLLPGAYVATGHGVMALIDEDTLHVEGYFEETKLARIHPGDPARIHLMGSDHELSGHVESIAGGITDRERSAGDTLLANVNPTFSWVRLAQRIPVRIILDRPADRGALVAGRTATVAIEPARQNNVAIADSGWRKLIAAAFGTAQRL